MDELQFIKESLKHDLEYWERAEKENPDSAFYRGTVASLRAFKEKIKFVLEDGGNEMPDKLDKCYYWHIITLATMKYKLRNLKGVRKV